MDFDGLLEVKEVMDFLNCVTETNSFWQVLQMVRTRRHGVTAVGYFLLPCDLDDLKSCKKPSGSIRSSEASFCHRSTYKNVTWAVSRNRQPPNFHG